MARTIQIDKATVKQIIDIDPSDIGTDKFACQQVQRTGRTFDGGLIEEWTAVFHWWETQKFYRVIYRKGSPFYRDSDEDFFDYFSGTTVECTEVVPVKKTITVYEDA